MIPNTEEFWGGKSSVEKALELSQDIGNLHREVETLKKTVNFSVERNLQKILDRVEALESRTKIVEDRFSVYHGIVDKGMEIDSELNYRIEELEHTMHSFNPNVVRRLMYLEEALGICKECGVPEGKHKMSCDNKNGRSDHVTDSMSYSFTGAEQGKFHTPADELDMRACYGDAPEYEPKSDVDISFTFLAEIEELEAQLADKIEELNEYKILADKRMNQADDWRQQRDFWKEEYDIVQNKLTKTLSLIYNGED